MRFAGVLATAAAFFVQPAAAAVVMATYSGVVTRSDDCSGTLGRCSELAMAPAGSSVELEFIYDDAIKIPAFSYLAVNARFAGGHISAGPGVITDGEITRYGPGQANDIVVRDHPPTGRFFRAFARFGIPGEIPNGGIAFGDGLYGVLFRPTGFVVASSDFNPSRTVFFGVPEPTTWTMLLIGFGAIGSAMRRKSPAAQPTV